MDALLLVSCFTAFFIAVIDRLISLGIFKAFVAIACSVLGCYLFGQFDISKFILTAVASSFLGPLLALVADKLSTFTRTLQIPARPQK
jgi:hypothetical protein